MIELRPEVQAFAEAMELKLRQNDHKGGWQGMKPATLFIRAAEELKEADEVVSLYLFDGRKTTLPTEILDELVDVANFLMMTADVCGALGISNLHDSKEVIAESR